MTEREILKLAQGLIANLLANIRGEAPELLNDFLEEKSEQTLAAIKEALAQSGQTWAKAWDEGYCQGVEDERTSESNVGIAGFGAKVEPSRQNPYKGQPEQPAQPTVPATAYNRLFALNEANAARIIELEAALAEQPVAASIGNRPQQEDYAKLTSYIDALEIYVDKKEQQWKAFEDYDCDAIDAMLAEKKELAEQPTQQEPVAITITGKLGNIYSFTGDYSLKKGDKVYTTPPQRKPEPSPVSVPVNLAAKKEGPEWKAFSELFDSLIKRPITIREIAWRCYLGSAIRQAQQEPWGFHIQFNNGKDATFKGLDKIAECEALHESGETITVLYTTPPQRKPLTYGEIADATKDIRGIHSSIVDEIARAIEAAHGIKESV